LIYIVYFLLIVQLLGKKYLASYQSFSYWEKEVEKIDPDTNQVMLGRAKEMLSHARWRAEREFPSQRGGAKVNINISNKVEMSEALNTIAGELLDHIAIEEK